MNKCLYCGAEYPDSITVCSNDQTPLVSNLHTSGSDSKEKYENDKPIIGTGGRWLIFSGIVWLPVAFFTCEGNAIAKTFGENVLPYILFFAPVAMGIIALVLYDLIPKKFLILIGITGWTISFGILYWFFWFGPGAIGHH